MNGGRSRIGHGRSAEDGKRIRGSKIDIYRSGIRAEGTPWKYQINAVQFHIAILRSRP
jgi:hypothetical protein